MLSKLTVLAKRFISVVSWHFHTLIMLTQWSIRLLLRKMIPTKYYALFIFHAYLFILLNLCFIWPEWHLTPDRGCDERNAVFDWTSSLIKSLFIDNVYMCTFQCWKVTSGASCALVCVAMHLVCIQLTLLRMWSVWCLFLFCHGLMLTDRSLSLSHCPSLSLPLFLSLFLHLPLSLFLSLSLCMLRCSV